MARRLFLALCLFCLTTCGEQDKNTDSGPTAVSTRTDFCETALNDRFSVTQKMAIESSSELQNEEAGMVEVSILYTFEDTDGIRADVFQCIFSADESAPSPLIIGMKQFGQILDKQHIDYTNNRVQLLLNERS